MRGLKKIATEGDIIYPQTSRLYERFFEKNYYLCFTISGDYSLTKAPQSTPSQNIEGGTLRVWKDKRTKEILVYNIGLQ